MSKGYPHSDREALSMNGHVRHLGKPGTVLEPPRPGQLFTLAEVGEVAKVASCRPAHMCLLACARGHAWGKPQMPTFPTLPTSKNQRRSYRLTIDAAL